LINYLIEGFEQTEDKEVFLRAVLKIIIKLLEEDEAVKNYSFQKHYFRCFEIFYFIELD